MSIVEQKLVILISGQRFARLLQRPLCGRVFGRIEMNQTSRSDLQGHKHIKQAKGGGYDGKEIASYDGFGMIFQEDGPVLVPRSTWPRLLLDVFGDSARRVANLQR